jgi:hypothetical protein
MKKDGCRPGTFRFGDKCITPEFPKIGTGSIPSVENKTGCNKIKGDYWDEKHNICVMQDDAEYGGYTAPIKGVVIAWYIDMDSDPTRWLAEVIACHPISALKFSKLEFDDRYVGCQQFMSWVPYFDDITDDPEHDADEFENFIRNEALTIAAMIKNGQVENTGLRYYDEKGREVTHNNRQAIAAESPHTAREAAKNFKGNIEPFKITKTPKPLNKKTIEKAKKFAAYVRDPYNKDRDIQATLGSFGITFDDDIQEMIKGLIRIGETKMANDLKNNLDPRFVDRVDPKYESPDWWRRG